MKLAADDSEGVVDGVLVDVYFRESLWRAARNPSSVAFVVDHHRRTCGDYWLLTFIAPQHNAPYSIYHICKRKCRFIERDYVTRLMRYCLECPANRYIFKSRLNCSESTTGSLRQSGSEFQTVGPATEKARVPKVPRRTRGTNSWWRCLSHRHSHVETYGMTARSIHHELPSTFFHPDKVCTSRSKIINSAKPSKGVCRSNTMSMKKTHVSILGQGAFVSFDQQCCQK